jgi:hypothetical protein
MENRVYPWGDRRLLPCELGGFHLNYSQEFHNSLVRRIPILDGLGWEASYAITRHPTDYPLYRINLVRTDILLGVRYATPFDLPVNFLLRASAGIGLSRLQIPGVES